MSNESNRTDSNPIPQPSDLKASDFFPPGEGWNQSEKPQTQRSTDELSQCQGADPNPN